MAAGYENNDADTTFNSSNSDTKGFTIVTYLGAVISDSLSADFAYGRSFLDTDQFRTAAGTQITSSFEGDRRFAAGNLTTREASVIGGSVAAVDCSGSEIRKTHLSSQTALPSLSPGTKSVERGSEARLRVPMDRLNLM